MSGPPPGDSPPSPDAAERPDLFIVEAGASRERRCADCGKRTERWMAVRRRGLSVILCEDCAASLARPVDEARCPGCGSGLRPGDRFCGRCGMRIEYACPACGSGIDADDEFCGKCGTRVA